MANGYGLEGMSRQMSTAMMSAPSLAIAIACARPCPRAAPVMNATLPSSFPVICAPVGVNVMCSSLSPRMMNVGS